MKLNTPFVITISRQLGSGGAFIGQLLAQKLNIFYADRYIINQAAKHKHPTNKFTKIGRAHV